MASEVFFKKNENNESHFVVIYYINETVDSHKIII